MHQLAHAAPSCMMMSSCPLTYHAYIYISDNTYACMSPAAAPTTASGQMVCVCDASWNRGTWVDECLSTTDPYTLGAGFACSTSH